MTRPGWVITRRVHRDCETCDEWAEAAITTAQVTGSIGGQASEGRASNRPFKAIDSGAYSIDHGARVLRADLWNGLRREHACEIRSTSAIDSPPCGVPTTTRRADVRLWACAEHVYYVGSRPEATAPHGVLPADRRAWRRLHVNPFARRG